MHQKTNNFKLILENFIKQYNRKHNQRYYQMSTILPQPIVSKSDDRKYRLIKLNNNDLEVILISDPTTDKSSAAVNVNAG